MLVWLGIADESERADVNRWSWTYIAPLTVLYMLMMLFAVAAWVGVTYELLHHAGVL
jgi:hypothetical protein